jgi:uncharacterized protein (TIGR02147 family)
MENKKLNIFEYLDFKKYLEDYYKSEKSLNPGFSHTYLCERLNQKKTRSYFNDVIKGRIPITSVTMERFVKLLGLNSNETKYFRALVGYNQTDRPEEKEFYFDQIVRLNNTPHRIINPDAYELYKEWHHSAVRAMLDIINVEDDYKEIAIRLVPSITVRQVRDSISLLNRLGLIARNPNGFWKPTDKIVGTSDFSKNLLIRHFQMKCLEHARIMLADGTTELNRNIAMTASLSEKSYQRISDCIQKMKTEIRSIIHKDESPSNKVYHINVNIFPMSR